MVLVKICKYCGDPIINSKHWKQKYHLTPRNGQTESCAELARKEKGCNYVRVHRKKFGRISENIIGSRNANLGASAVTNFDEEFEKVHKEKLRLVGS